MKACMIYKTKKHYKIVTMYKTDTGSYKLLDPIFILPIDIETELLGDKIFESLNTSKLIVNPNVSSGKELLKKLAESSYKGLYTNSASCMLFWENNSITIEPQTYSYEIKALVTVKDKIETINNVTKLDLVERVMEILSEN